MEPTGKTYVGSDELYADVQRTMRLCAEMNSGRHTEKHWITTITKRNSRRNDGSFIMAVPLSLYCHQ